MSSEPPFNRCDIRGCDGAPTNRFTGPNGERVETCAIHDLTEWRREAPAHG